MLRWAAVRKKGVTEITRGKGCWSENEGEGESEGEVCKWCTLESETRRRAAVSSHRPAMIPEVGLWLIVSKQVNKERTSFASPWQRPDRETRYIVSRYRRFAAAQERFCFVGALDYLGGSLFGVLASASR